MKDTIENQQIKNKEKEKKRSEITLCVGKYDINNKIDKQYLEVFNEFVRLEEKAKTQLKSNLNEVVDIFTESQFKAILDNITEVLSEKNKEKKFLKLYIDQIRESRHINELYKRILNLMAYADKTIIENHINNSIKSCDIYNLDRLKYIICGLLLNFNRHFNKSFKIAKCYRYSDVEFNYVKPGDTVYSNHFLSACLKDLTMETLPKDRKTVMEITLLSYSTNDFFINYLDLNDILNMKTIELPILICPFTKFKVTETKIDKDRQILKISEIKEFALNEKIFTQMFCVDTKNLSNHTAKQLKFFEKSIELTKNILGRNHKDYRVKLKQIGNFYKDINKTAKAAEFFEEAADIKYENSEKDTNATESFTKKLNKVADICRTQGETNKAGNLYEKSLDHKKIILGENTPEIDIESKNLADFYYNNKQIDKAFAYYEKCVEIKKKVYGLNSQELQDEYHRLADYYKEQNMSEKANELYDLSMEIKEKKQQENPKENEGELKEIALFYKGMKNDEKAIEFYEKSLKNIIKIYGEVSDKTIDELNELGEFYLEMKQPEKANQAVESSLDIKTKLYGHDTTESLEGYVKLAKYYENNKNYDKGRKNLKKAINIAKNICDYKRQAELYKIMANIQKIQKNKEKELKCYTKGLEVIIKNYGEESSEASEQYEILGGYYNSQKNNSKAIEFYKKQIEIKDKNIKPGELNDQFVKDYKRIGDLYRNNNDFESGIEFYEKSLDLNKVLKGDNNSKESAEILNEIGSCYKKKKEYHKALMKYDEAKDINIFLFGEHSPEVSTSYFKVGELYHFQKDFKNALEYFHKSLILRKELCGEESIEVAEVLYYIGSIDFELKNYKEAVTNLEVSKKIKIDKNVKRDHHTAYEYKMLGNCYKFDLKKKENVENYIQEYKDIITDIYGEEGLENAVALKDLGECYLEKKKEDNLISKSFDLFVKSIDLIKNIKGENHEDVAIEYINLGLNYFNTDLYDKAIECFDKAYHINIINRGSESYQVSEDFRRIGYAYFYKGVFKEASQFYKKSLEIKLKLNGNNHETIDIVRLKRQMEYLD